MAVQQLIKYLRLSVNVQDPDSGEEIDSVYLSMTDEDLLLYLNVVLTRDFASVPSLDLLPVQDVYPLTLLAKKELYYTLAVAEAPRYDLGADNNNYLKRSQRFEHYMALAKQADAEYEEYVNSGGGGTADDGSGAASNTLTSFDVLLNNRYFTRRYYQKGVVPVPQLLVDNVTDTYVELRWSAFCRHFAWSNVFLSTENVIDEYATGKDKVIDRKTLVNHFTDSRQTSLRLEGLEAETEYHVALEIVDMSGITGYSEVVFTTMPAVTP